MILVDSVKNYCANRMEKALAMIQVLNCHHACVLFMMAILYRISLDVYYLFAVSPQYAYGGLTIAVYTVKYVLSWIFYILIFITMPKQENQISSFCLNLQFVITVAPMLSYYGLNDQSTMYMVVVVIAVMLQSWILRQSKRDSAVGIHVVGLDSYVSVFMIILVPCCIGIAMAWNGFHGLSAFGFEFLYSIRENATYPPLLPYLLNWLSMIIIPFFLAFSLFSKQIFLSIVFILADLILYMIMGNKFIYMSLLVVIGVFLISKIGIPIKLLYLGFTALCICSVILFLLEQSVSGTKISVLINFFLGIRFLFIPARNKFLYYECFSEYPKALFSEGQIGSAFGLTYPYSGSLGQTVDAYDTGRIFASNSNTGYLGDSYAQMGVLGVLITAVMLAFLVKFFDACTDKKLFSVFAAAMATQFVVLNDGAFLTTLLTGGLFWLILFSIVYGNSQNEKNPFKGKGESS